MCKMFFVGLLLCIISSSVYTISITLLLLDPELFPLNNKETTKNTFWFVLLFRYQQKRERNHTIFLIIIKTKKKNQVFVFCWKEFRIDSCDCHSLCYFLEPRLLIFTRYLPNLYFRVRLTLNYHYHYGIQYPPTTLQS